MKNPAYFVAVFGKPDPPDKDTADTGRYPLGIRGTDTPGERGDILLLCCADSHVGNSSIVSGIGVVLTKNREAIYYRYLPFSSPLSRDQVERVFTGQDREKLNQTRINTYWLFEISKESFRNAARGVVIDWP
jgi:hypothetical protein